MARKNLYNWAKWFKEGKVVLVEGKDYKVSIMSMSQMARNSASRLGYSIRVIQEKEGTLTIKAVSRTKLALKRKLGV